MITLPASATPIMLADWLEASLFTQASSRLSDAAILDVLGEAEQDDAEDLLSSIHHIVRFRRHAVGDRYPFRKEGAGISREGTWQEYLPYSFMLLVSLNQSFEELVYSKRNASRPAELFEHLTAIALARYLDCDVVRIGAPRRAPMPAAFPKALEFTVGRLQEHIGSRDLEFQNSGDDGVDLVGWRTFGDDRTSQAVVLAQCSIGTDWKKKRNEIDLDVWRRHIDWYPHPLKSFAVPFHHDSGGLWKETTVRGGIIFDRLRIARLVNDSLPEEMRGAMEKWCHERLTDVLALEIERL